jgi:DNA-binding MarR family transcriptional regulator
MLMNQPSIDQLLVEFSETLAAMHNRIHASLGDDPSGSRLTINQFHYIKAIDALGEPTITQLAAKLKITKASVTGGINKLERLGYVMKKQSATDRRVYYLALTPNSQRLVDAKRQALKAYGEAVMAALTPAEAQQLTLSLAKIVKVFKAEQGGN